LALKASPRAPIAIVTRRRPVAAYRYVAQRTCGCSRRRLASRAVGRASRRPATSHQRVRHHPQGSRRITPSPTHDLFPRRCAHGAVGTNRFSSSNPAGHGSRRHGGNPATLRRASEAAVGVSADNYAEGQWQEDETALFECMQLNNMPVNVIAHARVFVRRRSEHCDLFFIARPRAAAVGVAIQLRIASAALTRPRTAAVFQDVAVRLQTNVIIRTVKYVSHRGNVALGPDAPSGPVLFAHRPEWPPPNLERGAS
jgi:hypothetical protein